MIGTIPVLRAKAGVMFERIAPAGFRILAALDGLTKVLASDQDITCGTEGHADDDPHTRGEAYDVSVRNMNVAMVLKAKTYLEQVLGSRFTVLYEVPTRPLDAVLASIAFLNPDASAPHFHIQPKKATLYPPEPFVDRSA